MSERTAQQEVWQDIEISPAAVCVLEFTSDIGETKRSGEMTYVTSKDAYVWAGLAAFVAEHPGPNNDNRFEDVDIFSALYYAVSLEHKDVIETNNMIPRIIYHKNDAVFKIDQAPLKSRSSRARTPFSVVDRFYIGPIFCPYQLVQAAQSPREVAGHGWRRRAGCRS
jgi:hypothetical protein